MSSRKVSSTHSVRMDLVTANSLSYEDFVENFGNVVEKCPIVAAAVWSKRPFVSVSELEDAVSRFIDALPESGKEGILRCYPDLAGRDLHGGTLTRESQHEHTSAGLDRLDTTEASRMSQLNDEYKQRFGFPFVICARMNDKATILLRLAERLKNEAAKERELGIQEVKKICRLRLHALLQSDTLNKL